MISDWNMFYAAQLGASAALAGLLFVGISINMAKIISIPILPNRALQSLILLGAILIISSLELVPGQSTELLGLEVLALGCVLWVSITTLTRRILGGTQPHGRRPTIAEAFGNQAAVLFYVIGGISTAVFGEVGLYLLVPAVLLSFIVVLIDAWVLLVEINR